MSLIKKNWTLFSIVILLISGGWIFLTARLLEEPTQEGIPAPRPGFLAPDFELQAMDGRTYRLSNLQGNLVLVNLWASWCPPCRAEMPALQTVYRDYQSQGFQILGINMTHVDDPIAAGKFVQEMGLTFPILMDHDGSVARLYQMQALPTTFIIDREGIVQKAFFGGPLAESLLRSQIMELLEAQ